MATGLAATVRRRLTLGILVLGAAAALPGIANAACPDRSSAQEFSRWLDPLHYTLVPGGDFEDGAAGWQLSRGARVVSGNEPFDLAGDGSRSLYLPSGSSARSPFVCVELLDPVARYVVRNRGSLLGALVVQAYVRTPLGTVRLPAGVQALSGRWQPSLPVLVLGDLTSVLSPDGTAEVAFRFKPTGLWSAWQIDDVFVDPFRGR